MAGQTCLCGDWEASKMGTEDVDEEVIATWEVGLLGGASRYGWANLGLCVVVKRVSIRLLAWGEGQW